MDSKNIKELLIRIADLYIEKEDELSKYDAVIGDGDHGITMARGAKAAKLKIVELENGTCRDYFKTYGRTLVSTLGGAMGPLFGSIFLELSKACKGKDVVTLSEFALGFKNAELKIMDLGGAKVGDKTMLDSIHPAVEALEKAEKEGVDMMQGFNLATNAAYEGVQATIPIIAKRGRSRYLQEKAIGHQDAGATSFYYLIKEIHDYIQSQ